MCINWLASAFNYFMVGFLVKYFPGNIYINSLMSTLSEIAAYCLAGYFYKKFGVIKCFMISFGIAVIGGAGIVIFEISTGFYKNNSDVVGGWLFPTLVIFAKLGVSAAFNINYVCNLDLFPVLFASTAYGFCNFLARLFTILSPQVAEIQSLLPMVLFTGTSLLAMITSAFLKPAKKEKETN